MVVRPPKSGNLIDDLYSVLARGSLLLTGRRNSLDLGLILEEGGNLRMCQIAELPLSGAEPNNSILYRIAHQYADIIRYPLVP